MWSINDRGRFGSVLLNPRMLVLGEKLHLLFFFFFFLVANLASDH